MKQYIDKDALVAEINQRIEDYKSHKIDDSYHDGLIFALEDLRDDFIDTLEVKEIDTEQLNKLLNWWKGVTTDYSAYKVKEVDFEKELNKEWDKCEPTDEGMGLEIASIEHEQFDNIAKYFFELGIKVAQKGE